MKKRLHQLNIGMIVLSLLILGTATSAQTMFRVQMKLPPPGQVGANYAYQSLKLYNNESTARTIHLKVIVTEESAGVVYQSESGDFECPSGYSLLDPNVIQSVSVTQIDPRIRDYIKRYQSLPGGKYKLCVTVFVAGSNSPTARDCYEESVIETEPSVQNQQAPAEAEKNGEALSVKQLFEPFAYTMQCDKNPVKPGDMLTYIITLKSNSISNIDGFRITAPLIPEFILQENGLSLARKGQSSTILDKDKYTFSMSESQLLVTTKEELAFHEELILTYTVMIRPDAKGKVISNKNVMVETIKPESKNIVNTGPLIDIVR